MDPFEVPKMGTLVKDKTQFQTLSHAQGKNQAKVDELRERSGLV
jgi:hypothetical protein